MATTDPLSLDTSTWNTLDSSSRSVWARNADPALDGSNASKYEEPYEQGQDEKISTQEAVNEEPRKTPASTLNEDTKASRRASRKHRPTRTRSLLDEIAAEKGLKDHKPATDEGTRTTASDAPKTSRRKHTLRLSDERRGMIESAVDELPAGEAEADGSAYSPASNPSTASSRVSFQSIEGVTTGGQVTSPISVPSTSGSYTFASPRPMLGLRTRSSNPDRQLLRRMSARSNSSSWSPASAFLSRCTRDETLPTADPDDEGQEIGQGSGYFIGKQIGYGGFSVVKEAHTIVQGEKVLRAVKIVRKQLTSATEAVNEKAQQEFEHEVTIWRYLKHRRILPLLAVFDTDFATFCIMQYSSGGTLFDVVAQYRRQSTGHRPREASAQPSTDASTSSSRLTTMPSSHAKHYIAQLASALRYLHQDVRIVHRDIKLENCLITHDFESNPASDQATPTPHDFNEPFPSSHDKSVGEPPPGDILLCDFGMADFISQDDRDDRLIITRTDAATNLTESRDPAQAHNHLTNLGPGPNSANISTTDLSASTSTIASNASTNDTTDYNSTASVEFAGSLPYASPELLSSSTPIYEASVDIWAFGVLCYAVLVGDLPFRHNLQARVVQLIQEGAWDVGALKQAVRARTADEGEVEKAVELVEGCLRLELGRRWNIGRVLRCAFLHGHGDERNEAEREGL